VLVKPIYVFLGLVVLILGIQSSAISQDSGPSFQELLTTKYSEVSAAQCPRAEQFQYVFVAGIFNELMPYYFTDQLQWLKKCGVPETSRVVARPYSGAGLRAASSNLKNTFEEMISRAPEKPLIIVGHSKGAPEALLAALQLSEENQARIGGVILMQGSFGGSPIADLALEYPRTLRDSDNPLIHRVARRLAIWLRRVEAIYGKSVDAGVVSIKTSEAKKFWRQFLEQHAESKIISQHKVFVLQTFKQEKRLNPFFFLSGQYLSRVTGEPTDGAIPFSSQLPPIKNVKPAVLHLDHLDTALPKAFSFSAPEVRYHLMASIVALASM